MEPLQDIKCKEEDKEVTFSCTFCKPSTRVRWYNEFIKIFFLINVIIFYFRLKNKVEIFHGLKYHFDSIGPKYEFINKKIFI